MIVQRARMRARHRRRALVDTNFSVAISGDSAAIGATQRPNRSLRRQLGSRRTPLTAAVLPLAVLAMLGLHALGPSGTAAPVQHTVASQTDHTIVATGSGVRLPVGLSTGGLPAGIGANSDRQPSHVSAVLAADLWQVASAVNQAKTSSIVAQAIAAIPSPPTYDGPSLSDVLSAQVRLATATLAVEALQQAATASQIAAAQQAVQQAEAQVEASRRMLESNAATPAIASADPTNSPTGASETESTGTGAADTPEASAVAVSSAQQDVADAQAALAKAQHPYSDAQIAQAQAKLIDAQQAVSIAQRQVVEARAAASSAIATAIPAPAAVPTAPPAANPTAAAEGKAVPGTFNVVGQNAATGSRLPFLPSTSDPNHVSYEVSSPDGTGDGSGGSGYVVVQSNSVPAATPAPTQDPQSAVQSTLAAPIAATVPIAVAAPSADDIATVELRVNQAQQEFNQVTAPADPAAVQQAQAALDAAQQRLDAVLPPEPVTDTAPVDAATAPVADTAATSIAQPAATASAGVPALAGRETPSLEEAQTAYNQAMQWLHAISHAADPTTIQSAQDELNAAQIAYQDLLAKADASVKAQIDSDPQSALLKLVTSPELLAGHSDLRAFVWPAHGTITSFFGPSHPLGIDIAQGMGMPVTAAASGVVSFKGGDPCCSYGYYVDIIHPGGYMTRYGHLVVPSFLKPGQPVVQGQTIGLSGSTGFSTGPHLHFEIRLNGVPLDPLELIAGASKQLLSAH